jgi:hypothetical protein
VIKEREVKKKKRARGIFFCFYDSLLKHELKCVFCRERERDRERERERERVTKVVGSMTVEALDYQAKDSKRMRKIQIHIGRER